MLHVSLAVRVVFTPTASNTHPSPQINPNFRVGYGTMYSVTCTLKHSHKQNTWNFHFLNKRIYKSRKEMLHKLIGPVREYYDFLLVKRGPYDHKLLLGKVTKLDRPDDNLKE